MDNFSIEQNDVAFPTGIDNDHGQIGWKTYNFEVAEHHTYVADGVRVHNQSVTYQIDENGHVRNLIDAAGRSVELDGDFTPDQLAYVQQTGTDVNGNPTYGGTLGDFFRSLADAIGFDGQLGYQGNFRDPNGNYLPTPDGHHTVTGAAPSQIIAPDGSTHYFDGAGNYTGRSYEQTDQNGVPTGAVVYENSDGSPDSTTFQGSDESDYYDNGGTHDHTRPIIVDLDGDGVEINASQQTYFDWDDDGFREAGSWVSDEDGFLVIDLNADGTRGAGDGVIDQTRELVLSLWGDDGDTDLQALRRAFDDHNNGVLDARDTIWSELRIWRDIDQDGETENDGSELRTLAAWGITAINLGYDDFTPVTDAEWDAMYDDDSDDITVFGNTLHGLASFRHDGSVITVDNDAVADPDGLYTASGGVGDVALNHDTQGWRQVPTAMGYAIEFETGQTFRYANLEDLGVSDLDLGAHNLDGATGDDSANVLSAAGFARSVQIAGGGGNDSITGGGLDDMMSGDAGADTIDGGDGNDLIFADGDDDVLGGSGYDTAIFAGDDSLPAILNLVQASIEAAVGGDLGDTLNATAGDTAVNIAGRDGNDSVSGSHENDTLSGDGGDDTINGGRGADIIFGGEGQDSLFGDTGDDYVQGGSGNDRVDGHDGDDDIYGGEGADVLIGGFGDDYLVGGAGADHLLGGSGDDVMIAGDGDDLIVDYGGVNWIEAGAGDDTIRLGDGVNGGGYAITYGSVLGGAGADTIELRGVQSDWTFTKYSSDPANSQWIITLNGTFSDNKPLRFDVHDIERVTFLGGSADLLLAGTDASTDTSDQFVRYMETYQLNWLDAHWSIAPPNTGGHEVGFGLLGSGAAALGDGANTTTGSLGTDAIDGQGGNDSLRGGAGSDMIAGGADNDTVHGDAGADSLWGGTGQDVIDGGSGDDFGYGGDGNDTINGSTGSDYLSGNAGDDSLNGGWDSDQLFGGDGADTLNGERGDDKLYGGAGDDSLIGYTGNDQLVGGDGNDHLAGSIGFDALSGNDGDDTLLGGSDDDWLIGGTGSDELFGGDGNDVLEGSAGADTINGQAGLGDVASYSGSEDGVIINLELGTASGGDAEGDYLVAIENVTGSDANDVLTGDANDNVLNGGLGDDTLSGGDGHDRLDGGFGDDVLNGGLGDDTLSSSSETSGYFQMHRAITGQGGFWNDQIWGTGDYDGDGNSDLSNVFNSGGATADVHVSDGTTAAHQRWATGQGGIWDSMDWMTGDFNGDGRDDLMKVWGEAGMATAAVHLSQATGGFAQNTRWADQQGAYGTAMTWMAGDFDGDGKDDLMKVWGDAGLTNAAVHLSNGVQFLTNQRWADQQGTYADDMTWLTGDFDGDGKDDMAKIWAADDGLANVGVHRSTGNSFTPDSLWAAGLGETHVSSEWFTADINNDGRDDIVHIWTEVDGLAVSNHGNLSANVYISDGVGFRMESWATEQGGRWLDQQWMAGDFNGDGRDDLLKVWGENGQMNSDVHFSRAHTSALDGGEGNDVLFSGIGNDSLVGGAGDDLLLGGAGADWLEGQAGDDTLAGEDGNDLLTGGAGSDVFQFARRDDADVIADFQDNIDSIELTGFELISTTQALSHASQVGTDVVFDFGNGDTLTISNTTLAAVADDVVLA
ncbi:calcium-binding protein [uncultured Tateyamaria sp.]|uniref:calcium-binding protein n=1 Tax=uncultured Tateyamaria sp. TaxID=455651 RepID=UPI002627B6A0|nr:calcium-binding protein [uncultured Tateyamaria sp.]